VSSTKVVIIVLVIVAVLFAGCIMFGVLNSSGKDTSSSNFKPGDYPVLSSMSSVLAPFAPKVAVSSLSPSTTTYNLSAVQSYSIKIQPASGQPFRRLDVATAGNCALSTLTLADPPDSLSKPQQNSPGDNPTHFIVTPKGGELQIERKPPINTLCIVTLQAGH
jgi:hypothetical protein